MENGPAGPSICNCLPLMAGLWAPHQLHLGSNSKSGNVTLKFTVYGRVRQISKKISVRSGIHKVDYGYESKSMYPYLLIQRFYGKPIKEYRINSMTPSSFWIIQLSENAIPKPGSIFALDVTGKNPTAFGTMGQPIGYLEQCP